MLKMKSEEFNLKSDGTETHCYKWVPEEKAEPKAVVQISHGMVEHTGRYESFAKKLVNSKYAVFGNDHRGHGKTADSEEDLGHLADENGWELAVEDMHRLTNRIKEDFPNIPTFLFGHSMGSFLTRDYIWKYGEDIDGVILSGTGGDPGPIAKIGLFISKIQIIFSGKKWRSDFLNNLIFDDYNSNFEPNRTDFDWLSREESEVDKYIEDSFCGFVPTAKFFQDLFGGLEKIHKQENIEKTPADLPIYLISGEKDPVGGFKEGVKEVYDLYDKVGIKDLNYRFYQGARHELLHETNKREVIEDIIDWLDKHLE